VTGDAAMNVMKEKLETLIKDLPGNVDIEEVMYRLYLLQKIEAGETAIKEGKFFRMTRP
jgi:hypothetical protein